MTKLLEWLLGVGIFLGIWAAIISRHIRNQLLEEWMSIIIPLPVFLLALFGLYAVSTVLWRVYTFNSCEEAARELQKHPCNKKNDVCLSVSVPNKDMLDNHVNVITSMLQVTVKFKPPQLVDVIV